MPIPAPVLDLLAADDLSAARALVAKTLSTGPAVVDARAWAEAAEAVGSSTLALTAWQAVLAHDPEAADALARLATLHAERGDSRRADACRARLAKLPGHETEPATEAPEPEAEPPDLPGEPGTGDLVRFAYLFAGREGVHARQWADGDKGGYSPVETSLTPELAAAHLRGDVTLGSYLVRRDDSAAQLVLDLDASKAALQRATGDPARAADLRRRIHEAGLALLAGLRAAGFDPLLVDSGFKGRHLWCLLPVPEPAARVRALGEGWARVLAPADPELQIEVFPKQDSVPAGRLGNLVKLPLGVHRRTGRRCLLLDDQGQHLTDPWERLRTVRRVPLADITLPPPTLVRPSAPRVEPEPESTPAADPATPGIPHAPAPPAFSEADFEARPRLAALLAGCPVLRAVVADALAEARLERDAKVVLEHSMGHLPEGVEGLNYLLRRAGWPAEEHMGAPHSGSPISCRQIRRRLSGVVQAVDCRCTFDAPESYPQPLLHLAGQPAEAPRAAEPPLEELLDALLRTEARIGALEAELRGQRAEAVARLSRLPGGRFTVGETTWRVEAAEGIPALVREDHPARSGRADG
ncbi:MAG: CRISPR-associated primase-polymerase type A1 [Pseudomonadota bacterium]